MTGDELDDRVDRLAGAERGDVVGVPVLGYVYNFAPLRREILSRAGSGARNSAA